MAYTASSTWSTGGWKAEEIYDRGWIPGGGDTNPWIQIDMLNVYTILGLMLETYYGWHSQQYSLKFSLDGNDYKYIGQNIDAAYLIGEEWTTYWFENSTDGRFWRIEPSRTLYHIHRCIKANFIGHI